jgi:hypothetical protein
MSYPLRALVDGLVRLVDTVDGPEDPACLDVLAALYVAAADLKAWGGLDCGTGGKGRAEPVDGIRQAVDAVRAIDGHDCSAAYTTIVRALLGIERALTNMAMEPDAAGVLTVDGIWSDIPRIRGEVRWWLRPRSLWADVLAGDERRTRRNVYTLPPHRLLRRIGFDWRRDGGFGDPVGCDPTLGDPYAVAVQRVRDGSPYLDSGVRVVLHPLRADLWPWFHLVDRGQLVVDVHADRYNDVPALEQALTDAVAGSRVSADPQLLVFPELMVDEPARVGVRAAVRSEGAPVFGVFAGSAHLALSDGTRVSQALVLDQAGTPWWTHHKRGSFRCVGASILHARREGRMFVPQDVAVDEAADYHEAFAEGTCLRFCDTTLGRLVVLVCSDLLDDRAWSTAIDQLEPDFLVVVSMSDRAARFLDRAKALAEERGVSTLYVNAACDTRVGADGDSPDRDVLAFAHLAVEDSAERPARICWRNGRGLERWDHKKRGWMPFSGGEPAGLEGEGMWIDLGAFLSNR